MAPHNQPFLPIFGWSSGAMDAGGGGGGYTRDILSDPLGVSTQSGRRPHWCAFVSCNHPGEADLDLSQGQGGVAFYWGMDYRWVGGAQSGGGRFTHPLIPLKYWQGMHVKLKQRYERRNHAIFLRKNWTKSTSVDDFFAFPPLLKLQTEMCWCSINNRSKLYNTFLFPRLEQFFFRKVLAFFWSSKHIFFPQEHVDGWQFLSCTSCFLIFFGVCKTALYFLYLHDLFNIFLNRLYASHFYHWTWLQFLLFPLEMSY